MTSNPSFQDNQNPLALPTGCRLRAAKSDDINTIRWLVFTSKLDPTQLRWQQFWVIEFDTKIIACGQLRSLEGAQELGSLVVVPQWRNKGLGSYLVQHLIHESTQPLYLECLGKSLEKFYEQLGFVAVKWHDLPAGVQAKFTVSYIGKLLLRIPVTFMVYLLAAGG